VSRLLERPVEVPPIILEADLPQEVEFRKAVFVRRFERISVCACVECGIETADAEIRDFQICVEAAFCGIVEQEVLRSLREAFYGEGIYYAVRSGNLAAAALLGKLQGRAPLSGYDRAMGGLRRDLFFSRLTARLFYLSPRLGHRYGVRTRKVSDLFAGVIAGTVSPARCLLTFLALAPFWLASAKERPIASPLFD